MLYCYRLAAINNTTVHKLVFFRIKNQKEKWSSDWIEDVQWIGNNERETLMLMNRTAACSMNVIHTFFILLLAISFEENSESYRVSDSDRIVY